MCNKKTLVQVAAAVIFNNKNEVLICQRPVNKNLPLKWEFPGGKLEEGETFEETCVRECLEELDIKVIIEKEFMSVTHEYDAFDVYIKLFNAHIDQNYKNTEPKKLEHNNIVWSNINNLKNYTFCPADSEVINKIIEENL